MSTANGDGSNIFRALLLIVLIGFGLFLIHAYVPMPYVFKIGVDIVGVIFLFVIVAHALGFLKGIG